MVPGNGLPKDHADDLADGFEELGNQCPGWHVELIDLGVEEYQRRLTRKAWTYRDDDLENNEARSSFIRLRFDEKICTQ